MTMSENFPFVLLKILVSRIVRELIMHKSLIERQLFRKKIEDTWERKIFKEKYVT